MELRFKIRAPGQRNRDSGIPDVVDVVRHKCTTSLWRRRSQDNSLRKNPGSNQKLAWENKPTRKISHTGKGKSLKGIQNHDGVSNENLDRTAKKTQKNRSLTYDVGRLCSAIFEGADTFCSPGDNSGEFSIRHKADTKQERETELTQNGWKAPGDGSKMNDNGLSVDSLSFPKNGHKKFEGKYEC